MRYLNGPVVTALLMTVIFSAMVLVATQYPPDARMLPLVIGIPGTILCFIQLSFELLSSYRKLSSSSDAANLRMKSANVKKELRFFLWFPGFIISVLLIGFMATTVIMVFLFLRMSQRESMKLSVGLSLGGALMLYVVFELVLAMPLFNGVINQWIFS